MANRIRLAACIAAGTVSFVASSFSVSAIAASASAAPVKAEQVCATCHGKDGSSPIDPSYPRLAGQHQDYLRRALLDYQGGARKNAIMAAQAKLLSKQEVNELSAYYSQLPGQLGIRR
jgi:cytochrome c553